MIRELYKLMLLFGIDLKKSYVTIKGLPIYYKQARSLKKKAGVNKDFIIKINHPILTDWYDQAGISKGHYFYQDLVVAQKIFNNNPKVHVDIGSRIDGFVAHIASFRKIEVLDIRNLDVDINNIIFKQADLMMLQDEMINYADSISCLHALEHFGLGRYGDPIDYDGHIRGFQNITKILKSGGRFYFSTPIGQQRIEFNAHRVFSISYLLNLFENDYVIESFSYVNDKGEFIMNAQMEDYLINTNFGCFYGCGIFELIKR